MRENGWYWVQVSPLISETWEAAKHAGGQWLMADRAGPLPDGVIHTVGPRILTPDELTVLRETARLAERFACVKGRHHSQHAMCDLMEHFGMPCVRPGGGDD